MYQVWERDLLPVGVWERVGSCRALELEMTQSIIVQGKTVYEGLHTNSPIPVRVCLSCTTLLHPVGQCGNQVHIYTAEFLRFEVCVAIFCSQQLDLETVVFTHVYTV